MVSKSSSKMATPREIGESPFGFNSLHTTASSFRVRACGSVRRSVAVTAIAFSLTRCVHNKVQILKILFIFLATLLGFLSHPQTVYPSYLTPPLSLAPTGLSMSTLASMGPHGAPPPPGHPPPSPLGSGPPHPGHTHVSLAHLSPHLSRMSPQNLATMATTPMSSSALIGSSNSNTPLTPPNSNQNNSPMANLSTSATSPQNLSASNATIISSTISHLNNSNNAEDAENSNADKSLSTSIEVLDVGRESPLNMGATVSTTTATNTITNPSVAVQPQTTDIRTNSIATLRIKAKEHLENINKNLAMV